MIVDMSDVWYFIKRGKKKRYGPYEKGEIVSLIRQGTLTEEDAIWHSGMEKWAFIEDTELAQYVPHKERSDYSESEEEEERETYVPRKRHTGRNIFLTIMALLIIAGGAAYFFKDTIKRKIVGSLAEDQAVSIAAKATGLSEDQIKDIISVVPKEDQQKLIEIASDHVNAGTVNEVLSIASSEGSEGVKDYVSEQLSDSEKEEVKQIAEDNQDAIIEKASEYGLSAETAKSLLPNLSDSTEAQQALQALQNNGQ